MNKFTELKYIAYASVAGIILTLITILLLVVFGSVDHLERLDRATTILITIIGVLKLSIVEYGISYARYQNKELVSKVEG